MSVESFALTQAQKLSTLTKARRRRVQADVQRLLRGPILLYSYSSL